MKPLTVTWLQEQHACDEGIDWFTAQRQRAVIPVLRALEADRHWPWANWLIVRVMTYQQYVAYAIYAAEQVLAIYEKQYPNKRQPRRAIEAAKACLTNPSPQNKKVAAAAAAAAYADAAVAAADAADAAADAAVAAAAAADAADAVDDADAAADAADAAADAAVAAADAAADAAAYAAAYAAYADAAVGSARMTLRHRILEHGIRLLEED